MTVEDISKLQFGEGHDDIKALFHGLVDTVFDRQCRATATAATPDADDPRRLARAIYGARLQRGKLLPAELLGEPAWDMLLDLYSRPEATDGGITTKSVCHSANVPYSTAWRMLALLENAGLVSRFDGEQDKRVNLVKLTERGEDAMRRCIIATKLRISAIPI